MVAEVYLDISISKEEARLPLLIFLKTKGTGKTIRSLLRNVFLSVLSFGVVKQENTQD